MKTRRLITEEVVHMPEASQMADGVLYLSREFELAIHLCACGCRGQTVTPLSGSIAWTMKEGPNGITLRPSIGNQQWPCRSHYWITDGKVEPC